MKKKRYTLGIMIAMGIAIISTILYGVYYLHTSLQNIQYSKNDAHAIVLQEFAGTIISSLVDYDDAKVTYELQVQNKNSQIIEVEVSAKTGEITDFEYLNIE